MAWNSRLGWRMLKFGHASPSGQRILQRCPVTPSPGTHARWPASRTRNLPVGDARDRIPEPAGPLPTRCRCLLPGRTRILAERAKSDETDGRRSTPQPNAVQRPALFHAPPCSASRAVQRTVARFSTADAKALARLPGKRVAARGRHELGNSIEIQPSSFAPHSFLFC